MPKTRTTRPSPGQGPVTAPVLSASSAPSGSAPLPPSAHQIAAVRREVDAVVVIMQSNLEKLIEREESLDTLLEKTEVLETDAKRFKNKATALNRQLANGNKQEADTPTAAPHTSVIAAPPADRYAGFMGFFRRLRDCCNCCGTSELAKDAKTPYRPINN